MKKETTAVENFNNGFNCSQAVLTAFTNDYNLPEHEAMRIAMAFGGGIGRMQKICGAVTGGYMALSLKYSQESTTAPEVKAVLNSKIQDFESEFLKKHGTTSCKELTACDFSTEEGNEKFKLENKKETVCSVCVADAIKLVEKL